MVCPSSSSIKRLLLLVLAAASMRCQVKHEGLAGPFADGSVAGGGRGGAATFSSTGGHAGSSEGPGDTLGAIDVQSLAGTQGSDGGPAPMDAQGSGGAGGLDGARSSGGTAIALDAGAGADLAPSGGSTGSGGSLGGSGGSGDVAKGGGGAVPEGGTTDTGGIAGMAGSEDDASASTGGVGGGGGMTESDGSPDGDSAPDANSSDAQQTDDARPRDRFDVGRDRAPVNPRDLPEAPPPDVPNPPGDVEDTPVSPSPDASEDTSSDSQPALRLLWSDEFEGDADSGVDTTKWSYATWPPDTINGELQQYTSSRENVLLDGDGHLIIRAIRTPRQTAEYTSGRIQTNGKFWFKTGRIEVSARLPAGVGSFPGIVMLGTDGAWPSCGEIGLMEQYGQDKSWFYASAYAEISAGSGNKRNVRHDFSDAITASRDFHVYSVDWYTDHLVFQVDGEEIMRTSFNTSSPFYTTAEYIILDVAVGGTMGGEVDTTTFPTEMVVDYVRVYSF
jgi:beta-glucanase (GH16 family)